MKRQKENFNILFVRTGKRCHERTTASAHILTRHQGFQITDGTAQIKYTVHGESETTPVTDWNGMVRRVPASQSVTLWEDVTGMWY